MSDPVLYEQQGRIVTLTMNRPDTRNALSADLVEGIVAALERANADSGVSCVIITGAGKGFSSGGNLPEIKAMTTTDNMSEEEIVRWYEDGIQTIPKTMNRIDVITIAAVHGHAIGAGCDLATMCDLRIAADNANFAESFLRVGIIPGDGGAWFLPRVIGMARAKEMLFTAAGIDAKKALDWGLVREVVAVDELLPTAMKLAEEVAGLPPQALRQAKQLIRNAATQTLEENLSDAARMQARLQQLDDHHEAIDAIIEKRKPSFSGS
jgi:enoyl-CoA hydratase/carnithine racemase